MHRRFATLFAARRTRLGAASAARDLLPRSARHHHHQARSRAALYFKLAMRELEYAFDEIDTRQGVVTSRIAIGTLATSGSFVLARAIDEFLVRCPGAEVNVVEEPYEQLLNHLRAGDIDYLISVLRRPDWATGCHGDKIVRRALCGRHASKASVRFRGLAATNSPVTIGLMLSGPSTPRYLAFERLFASARKKPTARVQPHPAALSAPSSSSDRLTLLTRHEALLEEKLGVLRIVPAKIRLPRRTYGVATRMNWHMVPEAEWAFWNDDANMRAAPEGLKIVFHNVRRIFADIAKDVTHYRPGRQVAPGIETVDAAGHTPGHTVFADEQQFADSVERHDAAPGAVRAPSRLAAAVRHRRARSRSRRAASCSTAPPPTACW